MEKIQELAYQHLQQAKLYSKQLYDRNTRPLELKIGQFAYVQKESKLGKLVQEYTGPYEIVDITEKGNGMEGRTPVYVDGSCSFNGDARAKAGIGIWFGERHPLNTYQTLDGTRATNIIAETAAAVEACKICLRHDTRRIAILMDSKYLTNCMTQHLPKWKTNGWLTSKGKPVVNQEMLQKLDQLIQQLNVQLIYIPGHKGIYGNERADELAKLGSEVDQ
ncbi:ribonuclease H1-like [Diachasma alloeum]|uniref:ribonuclease H1-like n=1 Tax=Diachasma alloeum TaxID=454923 RepID=UPI0007383A94|nr:ribonuclease H1-like [Diachasma alloeum]